MRSAIKKILCSTGGSIACAALLTMSIFSNISALESSALLAGNIFAAIFAITFTILYKYFSKAAEHCVRMSTTIFLLVLILIPLAMFAATNFTGKVSPHENRVLATKPDVFITNERFPKQVDAYIDDRIGYKYFLINIVDTLPFLQAATFDKNGKVIIGKNGWLFYNDANYTETTADFQRTQHFLDSELAIVAQKFISLKEWTEQHNIELVLLITPSKHNIYPEYYSPAYQQDTSKKSLYEQTVTYMKDNNIEIIDIAEILLMNKQHTQLYYKQDTHWTFYGGYLAYCEIMKQIKLSFPYLKILQYDQNKRDFSIEETGVRISDLYQMLKGVKLPPPLDKQESLIFYDNYTIRHIQNQDDRNKTIESDAQKINIFIVHDSFAEFFYPFLAHSASRLTNMWVYSTSPIKYQKEILDNKTDVLIWQIHDRYIADLMEIKGKKRPL